MDVFNVSRLGVVYSEHGARGPSTCAASAATGVCAAALMDFIHAAGAVIIITAQSSECSDRKR